MKNSLIYQNSKMVCWLLILFLAFSCLYGCGGPKDTFKESRRHFQSGLEHLRNLNIAEAILEFNYALHLDPGFDEPHYYLAVAYYKIGNLEEALRYFELYLKFNPEHTDTHLRLAQIYHRKGKDDKALEEGKYLLDKLPPGDAALMEVHNILGEIYLKVKKDYEAAAYHYRQVTEYDPKRPAPYLAFAQIYLAQEDRENAIRMLQQVLELDPENKESRGYLISLYRKSGKWDELVHIYQKMLQKAPANSPALDEIHSELAQVYWEQGKKEIAMEHAQQALKQDQANPQARFILAEGYLQNEQYELALEQLDALSKMNYKEEDILMDLALTYQRLARPRQAIDTYNKLIFIRPDNFKAQYHLTSLCLQTQQWECAIRGAKELLSRFYGFSPAYLFLGRAYLFQEDLEEAIKNLHLFFTPESKTKLEAERQFYEIAYPHLLPPKEFYTRNRGERNTEGHYLLGLAFLGKQRLQDALEEFNQVSQQIPGLGDVYLHKALAHHLEGNLDKAILNCQLALQQVKINKKLAHFLLVNLYTSKGELAKASKHLGQAEGLIYGFDLAKMDVTQNVSIEDPRSLAHLSLGVVYLLNGWKKMAKPELKRVLVANSHNPLAKYLNDEFYQLTSKHYYQSAYLTEVITQIYRK